MIEEVVAGPSAPNATGVTRDTNQGGAIVIEQVVAGPSVPNATGAARTSIVTVRRLLFGGAAAGPLFVGVALAQIALRPGFDIVKNAVSLLTLGSLGWVQSLSFFLTGALSIGGAIGMRHALRGGRGHRWVPILLSIYGAGLIGGGIFHPDPASGFPPGTPASASAVSSWHGVLHMVCGSLAFLALTLVCFVLSRRFKAERHTGWTLLSIAAGVVCLLGVLSGGTPGGTLTLFIGVGVAMLWVSFVEAQTMSSLSKGSYYTEPSERKGVA